jgi:Concanavalin A-like lectin/glucanases superfamily
MQNAIIQAARSRFAKLALILSATALGACSGGSGADVVQNVVPPASGGSSYSGPPPSTADVQAFKLNLWDNISGTNRCGACHSVDGGQSPMFARSDDINLAYLDANPVVALTSPEDSLMVTKVGGGHNCWLSSDAACADILTTWISNWAGELVGVSGRTIELEAPALLRDPGQSRNFPDDSTLFETTVYPLLGQFCSQCHASSATVSQSPFFAEGPSTDADAVDAAYAAARAKINLDDPASSRFVLRLRDEFHNCWSASCANDANAMEAAIQTFANSVPLTSVDPNLVTSKALTLYEGTVASGGNRYEASTIALYEFKTGQGTVAYDTSGVEPAMDLTLSGDVQWFGGWGLNFNGGKAQASTASSAKLQAALTSTGEYSIEAWVTPGNVVQEDSRIVSYSAGTDNRNFNIGQTMYNYDFFARTSNSDANGNPQMSTPDADEVLQATLQHVVATFNPVDGRKIYVNGVLVASQDPAPGGNLSDWDETYAFVLGNEVSSDRPWQGVVRLVAIHNRELSEAQILQNFEAGVGEKFFLLFGVEDRIGVPDSYVVFEASQYDSYAYLFRKPFFISLENTAQPDNIDIRGIRIGMNGVEAHVGQSFAKIDETISGAVYSAATGQALASLGGVLPLQKGPELDEFFLTFDQLGTNTFSRPPPVTPPPPVPQDLPAVSEIGVRTFDEINATMASITGVSPLEPSVQNTFNTVRQSLPTVETPAAFLASHQVAIAQLAIEYCNALVESSTLRAQVWPSFDFTQTVAAAFPGPGQAIDPLYDPLVDRVLGLTAQIDSQPDRGAVKAELDQLVYGIGTDPTRNGLAFGGGDQVRTRTIAKSVCSAVVGSAAAVVQ